MTAAGEPSIAYDRVNPRFGTSDATFDGVASANVSTPMAGALNLTAGNFTIEGWVYPNNNPVAIANLGTDGSSGVSVSFDSSDFLSAQIFYTPSGSDTVTASGVVGGSWQHFAVVLNGTTLTAYVDGVGGSPVTIGTRATFAGGFSAGNFWNLTGSQFIGMLDEIRVSNIARYTTDFARPTAPFVSDANTVLLLHMDAPPVVAGIQAKFAGPRIGTAVLVADAGNINPRIYPPQVDVTARVVPQRIL